jgi:hypothetical protein
VTEAQFIVGLENETPETLEETYNMAQDWKPDLVNWNCYTPWPFSDLFQELGDKVEVRDYAKYNFVTPIIQPDAMTRDEVLKRRAAQLPPLLLQEGDGRVPLGQGPVSPQVPARLPQGVPQERGGAALLRPGAHQLLGPGGGPDEGGVATLESDGHEHEAVGGYIAQAIRASEVEEARLMGCPTEPDRHPEPPPAA